eukprot:NODE_540_length_6251_cov_1.082250.p1 type:complete len:447 gc:universal NODE_540_length_6251_cov_1.082250:1383-2723(+)
MGQSISVNQLKSFQILNILPNSPAHDIHLIPYFDYIIQINHQFISPTNATQLLQLISQTGSYNSQLSNPSKDQLKSLQLTIYNSKSLLISHKSIYPIQWNNDQSGFLGCNIRLSHFHQSHQYIYHILSIIPNSPAHLSKLQSNSYIIGSPDGHYNEDYSFYDHCQDCANNHKLLNIWVYTPPNDNNRHLNENESEVLSHVRLVSVQVNYEWGGQGCLGADVGYGLLHRLTEEEPDFDALLQDTQEQNEPLLKEQPSEPPMQNRNESTVYDPTSELFSKIKGESQNVPLEPVQPMQKPQPVEKPIEKPIEKPQPVQPIEKPQPVQTPVAIPKPVQRPPVQQQPMQKLPAQMPVELPQPVQPVEPVQQPAPQKPAPVAQPIQRPPVQKPAQHPVQQPPAQQPVQSQDNTESDPWSTQNTSTQKDTSELFNELNAPLEDELAALLNEKL